MQPLELLLGRFRPDGGDGGRAGGGFGGEFAVAHAGWVALCVAGGGGWYEHPFVALGSGFGGWELRAY